MSVQTHVVEDAGCPFLQCIKRISYLRLCIVRASHWKLVKVKAGQLHGFRSEGSEQRILYLVALAGALSWDLRVPPAPTPVPLRNLESTEYEIKVYRINVRHAYNISSFLTGPASGLQGYHI